MMERAGSVSSGNPVRAFVAEIHYEESVVRRRLRRRPRGQWWSVVDCGPAGSSFVVGDTLTEVQREIIPGLRFLLEDERSTFFVTHKYATPALHA